MRESWLARALAGDLIARLVRAVLDRAKAPPITLGNDLASKIVRAMARNGYRVDAASGHVNIVYVEGMGPDGTRNDNAPNRFNDARFVIRFEGRVPKLAGAFEATTEPSRFWTLNPMSPKGAARIKFGQYAAWRVGTHHAGSPAAHEALVQVGAITVCRDLNKDFQRAGDREDTGDGFGVNQHWGYDLPRGDLGRSSAGCLVGRSTAGHRAFMAIVKSDPRYVANRGFVFATTIMPAREIV